VELSHADLHDLKSEENSGKNVNRMLVETSIRKTRSGPKCLEVIERRKRKKSDVAMIESGKLSS
jgi:hypothetical protein